MSNDDHDHGACNVVITGSNHLVNRCFGCAVGSNRIAWRWIWNWLWLRKRGRNAVKYHRWPALSQGVNKVSEFIPVARVADMLLLPNRSLITMKKLKYPDIKLVYWAR